MSDPQFVVDLLLAFNLGLASQLHCAGMCGGILAALALGLTPAARAESSTRLAFALACNAGRILAYAAAGALLATFAAIVLPAGTAAYTGLRVVASLVLIASGLSLAGILPQGLGLEAAGLPLWRRLQPLARRLLPIRAWPQAFAFGLLWGWLPCALVYSALVFAATRAEPLAAAGIMLAFGAGTLPLMVAGAWLASGAPEWCRRPGLRRLAGAVLIAGGLVYPFIGGVHHPAAPDSPAVAPHLHHAH